MVEGAGKKIGGGKGDTMHRDDGMGRMEDLFDLEDDSMMFYRKGSTNKFLYCCVWGEHISYSIFVGTWKGCPPGDPIFTEMIEYRYSGGPGGSDGSDAPVLYADAGEDESIAWEKKSDKLIAEARAAGACAWNDVANQAWWKKPRSPQAKKKAKKEIKESSIRGLRPMVGGQKKPSRQPTPSKVVRHGEVAFSHVYGASIWLEHSEVYRWDGAYVAVSELGRTRVHPTVLAAARAAEGDSLLCPRSGSTEITCDEMTTESLAMALDWEWAEEGFSLLLNGEKWEWRDGAFVPAKKPRRPQTKKNAKKTFKTRKARDNS